MEKFTVNKNRENALTWWRELKLENKITLANIYFPNMNFLLIDKSSSKIQTIWEKCFGI